MRTKLQELEERIANFEYGIDTLKEKIDGWEGNESLDSPCR